MIKKNISLVATTFNNEDEILLFLDNIFSQSYLPGEIVISDGGSKDKTVELILNYQQNTGENYCEKWETAEYCGRI